MISRRTLATAKTRAHAYSTSEDRLDSPRILWARAGTSSSSTASRGRPAQSRPCFTALREERALPTAVTGPRDLAPLARAMARLRSERDWNLRMLITVPLWGMEMELGRARRAKLLQELGRFRDSACDPFTGQSVKRV